MSRFKYFRWRYIFLHPIKSHKHWQTTPTEALLNLKKVEAEALIA